MKPKIDRKYLENIGFTKEVARINDGKCPQCNNKIKKEKFKSKHSLNMYKKTGFCHKCQIMFGINKNKKDRKMKNFDKKTINY